MKEIIVQLLCSLVLSLILMNPTNLNAVERCDVDNSDGQELLDALEIYRANRTSTIIPDEITIPVAWHVIRAFPPITGDLTQEEIDAQMLVLNEMYNEFGILFELIQTDRTTNSDWSNHAKSYESEFKSALNVDPEHILNIYSVVAIKLIIDIDGVLGEATFPDDYPEDSFMHGLMLKATTLPGGSEEGADQGYTAVHEIGHYLGLLHVFQGGCDIGDDDGVIDTPKMDDDSDTYRLCDEGKNTCPADGDDPIHNFMGYTPDDCMYEFTAGQMVNVFDIVEMLKPGLYHVDIPIANSEIDVPGGNLGGQLSLDQLAGDEDYFAHPSGEDVAVIIGYDYTAWTHNKSLIGSQGEVQHYDWSPNPTIKTINAENPITDGQTEIEALFKDVTDIQILSVVPEALEFHDPWYIQNLGDDPGIWIQPDEFRPLSELTANGNYEVFLEQNQDFDPELDIYRLRAPQSYVSLNGIYEFINWSGVDIAFNVAGDNSTSNNETPIVFLTDNASVSANYEILNLIPNNQISVEIGEQLIIPAGANIPFAEGVQIEMHGGDLIVQGTNGNPIRLYPETNSWKGLVETLGNSSVIIDHATLEGANDQIQGGSSLYFYSSSLMISNSTFLNCGAITTYDEIDLNRNIFISDGVSESPALDIRNVSLATISNNTFINHKFSIKGSQAQTYSEEYQMFNNIFYFNSTLHNNANTIPFVQDPSFPSPADKTMFIDYNLFYGYAQNGLSPIPHFYWMNSQIGNPEFVDVTNGNFYLTPYSTLAIDLGRPDSQYNDPDGSRGDLGAHPLSLMGGIQSLDVTMQGSAWITADYVVASNANLSILPGTELFFAENKKITIEGSLIALGSSEEPVLFSPAATTTDKQYWGGVVVNEGTVNLTNVEIRNGKFGLYLYRSGGTISGLTLENNYYGINYYQSTLPSLSNSTVSNSYYYGLYVNGVAPDFDIIGNNFTDNRYGMYLYNFAGLIRNNTVMENIYDGIRFYSQSSANMTTVRIPGDTPYAVNNHISNTTSGEGIEIYAGSFPILGDLNETPIKVYGGFNEFFANTGRISVRNNNGVAVEAELNWWSGNWDPGKFNWNPTVDSYNPGGGMKKSTNLDLDSLRAILREADHLLVDSLYTEAIGIYYDVISTVPEDSLSVRALIGMTACYNAIGDNEALRIQLQQIIAEFGGQLVAVSALDYYVVVLVRENNLESALFYNEAVIAEYESMDDVDEALASTWFEQSMIYEDMAMQAEVLGKSSTATINLSIAKNAQNHVLEQYNHTDIANLIRVLNGEDEIEITKPVVAPAVFTILPVYPNPFNPSTTIRYALPKTSDVLITVYDLLGRNIWSHEEVAQSAGTYSLQWNGLNKNGTQAASGIYLVSFSTSGLRAVQKAALIR